MKVTPLDLRQAQFRSKLRGFDPDEVTPFLADAAYELEQALKEIDRLRQEAAKTEVVLDEFRERENALRNTLLTAQRLADQIKENAEVESKTILREAESRADLLLQKAQGRLTELDRDINEMRVRRRDVESSLETSIASLSYALDFMRTQDHQGERDEALLHRPKMDATTARSPSPARLAAPRGPRPRRGRGRNIRLAPMPPVLVQIRVIPRARRTEISGRRGDAIVVRLAAPPVDGAANEALIAFLADRLGIPRRQIALARGATARDKTIAIDGLAPGEIARRLGAELTG
jgi:uncharacterized protein (TIGR00251 family)